MTYYVYILSNKRNTVFYTGLTNDLSHRVMEHKTGFYQKSFSKKYNVNQLLYYEEYSILHEALAREKELKKFRREWKLQLIQKQNPQMRDLSEGS